MVDIAALRAKAVALAAAKRALPSTPIQEETKSEIIQQQLPADQVAGSTAPLSNFDQISQRIDEIRDAVEAKIPGYVHMLRTIHTALATDDAIAHLLTDSQVGILMAALKTRKNVVFVEKAAKSKSTGKSLSKVTLDDL